MSSRLRGAKFREETGLEADLWLCGTIVVDAGEIGIGLYVFTGEVTGGSLRSSREGESEWVAFDHLGAIPTVSDLPQILSQIHAMKIGDRPFSGRSFYDEDGSLRVAFRG